MDSFTTQHLDRWADATLFVDERDAVLSRIRDFVAENPEVLADRSWPEIRGLAERSL